MTPPDLSRRAYSDGNRRARIFEVSPRPALATEFKFRVTAKGISTYSADSLYAALDFAAQSSGVPAQGGSTERPDHSNCLSVSGFIDHHGYQSRC